MKPSAVTIHKSSFAVKTDAYLTEHLEFNEKSKDPTAHTCFQEIQNITAMAIKHTDQVCRQLVVFSCHSFTTQCSVPLLDTMIGYIIAYT